MIGVVHLIWGPLGAAPLRAFISSYMRQPAGADHELVLLLNGVQPDVRESLLHEVDGVDCHVLQLDSSVQDLAAYAHAIRALDYDRLCFLNSYSELLCPGWLAKLNEALYEPKAGIAGATGSWASLRSLTLDSLGVPTAYRGAGLPRGMATAQLAVIEAERITDAKHAKQASSLVALARRLRAMPGAILEARQFEAFPNPHIRTNAFMARRETLLRLAIGEVRTKTDAYRLESGHDSITRRLERMDLRPVVVDRNGDAHVHGDWPRSHTLWQGDQERLLVADNQTHMYSEGDDERRRFLSILAWGTQAEQEMQDD